MCSDAFFLCSSRASFHGWISSRRCTKERDFVRKSISLIRAFSSAGLRVVVLILSSISLIRFLTSTPVLYFLSMFFQITRNSSSMLSLSALIFLTSSNLSLSLALCSFFFATISLKVRFPSLLFESRSLSFWFSSLLRLSLSCLL